MALSDRSPRGSPGTVTRDDPIADLVGAVRSGIRSATSVVIETLSRISAADAGIGSFVLTDRDGALDAAARVDAQVTQGIDPGRLAGLPIAVKDVQDVRGLPTRLGSIATAGSVAAADDPAVAPLRAAGAIVVGKTAVGEFGTGFTTGTRSRKDVANPANPLYSAGGSSGGSAAAVAAGLVLMATGTDAGGSLRLPASYCGVVGFKPGRGTLSLPARDRTGFSEAGTLVSSVTGARRWLEVMTDSGPAVPHRHRTRCRVALLDVAGEVPVEPDVARATRRAARALLDRECTVEAADGLELPADLGVEAWGIIATAELLSWARAQQIWPERASDLTEPVRVGLEAAEHYSDELLDAACNEVKRIKRLGAGLLQRHDVLLTPAAAVSAPLRGARSVPFIAGREASQTGLAPFAPLANICGMASIAIPVGTTRAGLPVGVQLTTRPGWEYPLLDLAAVLEASEVALRES